MKTTVVLMRHGHVNRETDSSGKGLIYGPYSRLSLQGRAEIPRLAHNLRGITFDAIYSSSTTRALQSTDFLVESLQQPESPNVFLSKNLRSVMCPSQIGKPIEGATDEDGFYINIDKEAGDESLEEYGRRIWREFREIVATNQGRTIGIMGHSEGIGLIMHKLHNPGDSGFRIEKSIPTASAIKFEYDHSTHEIENESTIREQVGGKIESR